MADQLGFKPAHEVADRLLEITAQSTFDRYTGELVHRGVSHNFKADQNQSGYQQNRADPTHAPSPFRRDEEDAQDTQESHPAEYQRQLEAELVGLRRPRQFLVIRLALAGAARLTQLVLVQGAGRNNRITQEVAAIVNFLSDLGAFGLGVNRRWAAIYRHQVNRYRQLG